MQWPCAVWYHVPTIYEWCQAITNINWNLTCTAWTWQNENDGILNDGILKLPFSAIRLSNSNYHDQGIYGRYWSSSPSFNSIYSFDFSLRNSNEILINNGNRWHGFSVRCLKN